MFWDKRQTGVGRHGLESGNLQKAHSKVFPCARAGSAHHAALHHAHEAPRPQEREDAVGAHDGAPHDRLGAREARLQAAVRLDLRGGARLEARDLLLELLQLLAHLMTRCVLGVVEGVVQVSVVLFFIGSATFFFGGGGGKRDRRHRVSKGGRPTHTNKQKSSAPLAPRGRAGTARTSCARRPRGRRCPPRGAASG